MVYDYGLVYQEGVISGSTNICFLVEEDGQCKRLVMLTPGKYELLLNYFYFSRIF